MSYIRVLEKTIPLNNSYENVISFKDLIREDGEKALVHISRTSFFKSYDTHFNDTAYYTHVNFKIADTLKTTLRVDVTKLTTLNTIGVNYVHIINTSNKNYPSELFYFINNIIFLNGNIAELELELDVFTTYFSKLYFKEDSKKLYVERCHCDRYTINGTNQFGCEESLLGDIIDTQFSPNVTRNSVDLLDNEKVYLLLYLSYNVLHSSQFSTGTTNNPKPIYLSTSTGAMYDYGSYYNDIALPYIIGVLPLTTINLTLKGNDGRTSTRKYGINAEPQDFALGSFTYFKYINENTPYIIGAQLVKTKIDLLENYDGSSQESNFFIADIQKALTDPATGYDGTAFPIVCLRNIKSENFTNIENINFSSIYNYLYGAGRSFTRSELENITERNVYLEPKLYVYPYSSYAYTGAIFKDATFEPIKALKNVSNVTFKSIWSPNPNTSGERLYIASGYYKYAQETYAGSSPVITSEIPIITSAYQEFLTSQKNSFYTGLAISMFSGAFNTGVAVASGGANPYAMAEMGSNLIETIAQPFIAGAKIQDLKNTPNKYNSNNFDVYGIIGSTDLSKRLIVSGLTDSEVDMVSTFYYLNGYLVEQYRDIDFDLTNNSIKCYYKGAFTRKLFNFLKIKEDLVECFHFNEEGLPISMASKRKLNEVMRKGVRIWNITTSAEFLNFSLENKEVNAGTPLASGLVKPTLNSGGGNYTYQELVNVLLTPNLHSGGGNYTYESLDPITLTVPYLHSGGGNYTYVSLEPPKLTAPSLYSGGGNYTYEDISPRLSNPDVTLESYIGDTIRVAIKNTNSVQVDIMYTFPDNTSGTLEDLSGNSTSTAVIDRYSQGKYTMRFYAYRSGYEMSSATSITVPSNETPVLDAPNIHSGGGNYTYELL